MSKTYYLVVDELKGRLGQSVDTVAGTSEGMEAPQAKESLLQTYEGFWRLRENRALVEKWEMR